MSVLRGDYIGFTYNGKHSSDLGIVRTSNGSRFDESLLPTMQDKTAQVPGGDGTYYFGSYYTSRQFSVSFAFDNLTEEQIAQLKSHFGDKKIHDLIFDERPYKTWRAKVTGSATLKYVPFAESETNRIYKGEGTIQFTCYQPYAICEKKWLDQYTDSNKNEWALASGLKSTQGNYDILQGANSIKLWNPGDLEAHFLLKMNFDSSGKIAAGQININEDSSRLLRWNEIAAFNNDSYIKFNTKLNLIEGYRVDGTKSGNIYNHAIKEGAFFTIPQGETTLIITDAGARVDVTVPIEYNYYYF